MVPTALYKFYIFMKRVNIMWASFSSIQNLILKDILIFPYIIQALLSALGKSAK